MTHYCTCHLVQKALEENGAVDRQIGQAVKKLGEEKAQTGWEQFYDLTASMNGQLRPLLRLWIEAILVKETALAYDQGYAAASVRKEREMIAKGTECHI